MPWNNKIKNLPLGKLTTHIYTRNLNSLLCLHSEVILNLTSIVMSASIWACCSVQEILVRRSETVCPAFSSSCQDLHWDCAGWNLRERPWRRGMSSEHVVGYKRIKHYCSCEWEGTFLAVFSCSPLFDSISVEVQWFQLRYEVLLSQMQWIGFIFLIFKISLLFVCFGVCNNLHCYKNNLLFWSNEQRVKLKSEWALNVSGITHMESVGLSWIPCSDTWRWGPGVRVTPSTPGAVEIPLWCVPLISCGGYPDSELIV